MENMNIKANEAEKNENQYVIDRYGRVVPYDEYIEDMEKYED